MLNINNSLVIRAFTYFSTIFYIYYFFVKPVYIVLLILIFFGYYYKKYIINVSYLVVSFTFSAYLIFSSILNFADVGMIFNAIISMAAFPILFYYCKNSNIKHFGIFLLFSVIFLMCESLWRITHPVYWRNSVEVLSEGDAWFYPYKMSSFMFQDSNFVALHIYCLLFISLFLKQKVYSILFFILMILTFSRSGILGALVIVFIFTLNDSKYSNILKPIGFFVLLYLFIISIMNVSNFVDGSFLTKFHILEAALNYANYNFKIEQYLFGVGLSNTYSLIGIGAHNIAVVLFFETGLIGGFLYILYFSIFYNKTYAKKPNSRLFIFIYISVFLMMGFSLGLYIFPVMIMGLAIIGQDRSVYV